MSILPPRYPRSSDLTPEERQKIYEEEKARVEKAESPGCLGCLGSIVLLIVIIVIGMAFFNYMTNDSEKSRQPQAPVPSPPLSRQPQAPVPSPPLPQDPVDRYFYLDNEITRYVVEPCAMWLTQLQVPIKPDVPVDVLTQYHELEAHMLIGHPSVLVAVATEMETRAARLRFYEEKKRQCIDRLARRHGFRE